VSQFELPQRVVSGYSRKLPEIRQCANCGRPELIENDQPQIITRLSAEFPGFDAILRGYAVRGSGLGTWFVVLATKAGGR
jgi:hypothetical protein